MVKCNVKNCMPHDISLFYADWLQSKCFVVLGIEFIVCGYELLSSLDVSHCIGSINAAFTAFCSFLVANGVFGNVII